MSARENEVVAEFVDQYGDKRIVHRSKRSHRQLQLKNNESTVSLTMNRIAGVEIGRRIRAHREAADMTLEDLCQRAGLAANASPKARMWEIENSIRQQGVRFGTLYAISRALGVPIENFLPSTEEVAELAGIQTIIPSPILIVKK